MLTTQTLSLLKHYLEMPQIDPDRPKYGEISARGDASWRVCVRKEREKLKN